MNAPVSRTDEQARALLGAEVHRLDARRGALGDAGVHSVAGWTLENAMEWEAAALAWSRVLDVEPADAVAMFHLGVCRLETGRNDDAAAAFRRAIALDEASPRLDWFDEDPEYRLGNALHAAGDFAAAIEAYERSAARNVLAVDSLREIVRLRIVREEPREALEALSRMEHRAVRLTVRAEVQALRVEIDALRRARRS